jgi:methyl-accepting chemotaxis protein
MGLLTEHEDMSNEPLHLGFRGRLPLGFQVLVGIGVLVLLVVITGGVGVVAVLGLQSDETRLSESNVPYANAIALASLDAKGIANDERGYLLTGEARFVHEMDGRLESARAAFATASDAAITSSQRQSVTVAREGFERWVQAVELELDAYRNGDRQDSVAAALGPHRELRKAYERTLAQAKDLADGALRTDAASITSTSRGSIRLLAVTILVAVVVGSGVAVWVIRTILRPVYAMLRLFADVRRGAAEPF